MNYKQASAWILMAALTGGLFLAGCEEQQPNTTTSTTLTAPATAPAPTSDGLSHAIIFVPTGVRETSVLVADRAAPAEVSFGQPFPADITVTNLTAAPINSVEVTDQCATNFKLESSDPAVTKSDNGGVYHWVLGGIGPHESRVIKITGSATGLGLLQNCLSISYDQKTCLAINVVQPKLTLTAEAPSEVLKCDNIPVKYTVTNTGTGTAHHVVVTNNLPANAVTSDGENVLSANVGDLEAGGSRAFSATLKATDVGTITNPSTATGDGDLTASASTTTAVKAPKLKITETGNDTIYAGRNISYDITLTNVGDGDANDTVLTATIPAGTKLVSATSDATADASGVITWKPGTLKPGTAVKANVVVEADNIGDLQSTSQGTSTCAEAVAASVPTSVRGIPAVLLEMVDVNDPIEVGNVETYIITVTNQGTADITNIVVKGILEDTMSFNSADGATAGTFDGASTVTFAPLATIAPKAKAVWTVKVKAEKPGDVRFKTTITTDQLTRPVEKTEATNFYK